MRLDTTYKELKHLQANMPLRGKIFWLDTTYKELKHADHTICFSMAGIRLDTTYKELKPISLQLNESIIS